MGRTATLPLHLHGPLMSFGSEEAREGTRPSDTMPRKSMVVGILAAALGRKRGENISDLASLRCGSLVINSGRMENDFQRVDYIDRNHTQTIIGQRGYISDGDFVVAVEGDREFLEEIHKALLNPKWALYMGRSSCPAPPDLAMDIIDLPLKDALLTLVPEKGARLRIESHGTGQDIIVRDKPLSFEWGNRRYGSTMYEEIFVKPGNDVKDDDVDFFDFV